MEFVTDFAFVTDATLRRLAEEFFRQAVACRRAGGYLGCVVTCGGLLEGVLVWALASRGEEAARLKPGKRLEDWGLASLIDGAIQLELLGHAAGQAAWSVKEFRNYIHPMRILQTSLIQGPNEALAVNALTAVQEIVRSLSARMDGSAPGACST